MPVPLLPRLAPPFSTRTRRGAPPARNGLRTLTCAALLIAALGGCDDGPQDSDASDASALDGATDTAATDATGDATATATDATGDTAGDTTPADTADGADMPDMIAPAPDYANVLDAPSAFADLVGTGGSVKYLINVDGVTPVPPLTEQCTFQNSTRFEFHIQFLRAFPELADTSFEQYTDWVLAPATRVWWGGTVALYPATPHPDGGLGAMIYTVYTDPGGADPLSAADLAEVDAALSACVPWAADLLVFVPENPTQLQATQAIAGELEAAGVAFLPYQQLIDRWSSSAVVSGAATGELRIVPSGQPLPGDLGPTDVVLVEEAPADDPGVAVGAWISTTDVDESGAFATAMAAAGTPVAVLSSGLDNDVLAALDGHPVGVTVDGAGLSLVPARE